MKVMKLNNAVQKVNAVQLAKTINKTKTLPSDITKDYANTILKTKSKKLTIATLVGLAGMVSSFFIFGKSIDVQNVMNDIGATALLMASSVFATAKSCKNKIIDKAQDILSSGNDKS